MSLFTRRPRNWPEPSYTCKGSNDQFSVHAIHPDGTTSYRYASFPGKDAAIRYADDQAARLSDHYKQYAFAVMIGRLITYSACPHVKIWST